MDSSVDLYELLLLHTRNEKVYQIRLVVTLLKGSGDFY